MKRATNFRRQQYNVNTFFVHDNFLMLAQYQKCFWRTRGPSQRTEGRWSRLRPQNSRLWRVTIQRAGHLGARLWCKRDVSSRKMGRW